MPDPTPIRGRWTTPEGIARAFHEAYESLADGFGYRTRTESAVPWEQVPGANKALMVATVRNVLIEKRLALAPVLDEQAIERAARRCEELADDLVNAGFYIDALKVSDDWSTKVARAVLAAALEQPE